MIAPWLDRSVHINTLEHPVVEVLYPFYPFCYPCLGSGEKYQTACQLQADLLSLPALLMFSVMNMLHSSLTSSTDELFQGAKLHLTPEERQESVHSCESP
jgi:hypothetical protein